MKTKRTQWVVVLDENHTDKAQSGKKTRRYDIREAKENGLLIATVWREDEFIRTSNNTPKQIDQDANAKLIAAAPETAAERDRLKAVNAELLEAVLTVRKRLVRVCAAGDGMQAFLDAGGLRELAAAITKAEGK